MTAGNARGREVKAATPDLMGSERQPDLDELGELWDGKFDIFCSHGLYWARSTTDSVRLAADTTKGLQALLAKIA